MPAGERGGTEGGREGGRGGEGEGEEEREGDRGREGGREEELVWKKREIAGRDEREGRRSWRQEKWAQKETDLIAASVTHTITKRLLACSSVTNHPVQTASRFRIIVYWHWKATGAES